ncbi:DUF397 domain-containing protein [Pseudonocardiaceae bacterium YIM PH 21723]|nr:DUF397 domain-containing protein [Pseudonocardiaceae bacterium YIM PH 21723]
MATIWRKSSRSGGDQPNCVEMAWDGNTQLLRDSKNASGPVLRFRAATMTVFLNDIKAAGRG